MRKLLLCFTLMFAMTATAGGMIPDMGDGGQYDGIWLFDTGQYATISYNHGQVIIVQLDNELYSGQGREWVAYSGPIEGDQAVVRAIDGFSDFHAVFDIHFTSPTTLIGLFTICDSQEPLCTHSGPAEVSGQRVW